MPSSFDFAVEISARAEIIGSARKWRKKKPVDSHSKREQNDDKPWDGLSRLILSQMSTMGIHGEPVNIFLATSRIFRAINQGLTFKCETGDDLSVGESDGYPKTIPGVLREKPANIYQNHYKCWFWKIHQRYFFTDCVAHARRFVSSTGAHEAVDDLAKRNDSWDPCIPGAWTCVRVYSTNTYLSRTKRVDKLDFDLDLDLISR